VKRVAIVVAMTVLVVAVYVLRLDDVAGLYKDDAYYMVLAKSLALGDGYALISSATTPIMPAFPPGFPLLLAPVFAVAPQYPGNLFWLKLISIASMIGAGALTYRYFAGDREIARGKAATIALLTVLTPGFVFLATSTVMAECVFTLALIGSAVTIERVARRESRFAIVAAALTTTAAWLIRSAGIALVGGGALFIWYRRGWRAAAGFVAVCAISYAPWAAYSFAHGPTAAESAAHGGAAVYSYAQLLQTQQGGDVSSSRVGLGEVPLRVLKNVVNVFGHDLGAVILPAGYRDAAESGLEVFMLSGETGMNAGSMGLGTPVVVLSIVVSLVMILGALVMARQRIGVAEVFCVFTVGMVLLLPGRTYRYVLPIAPLLIGYFLIGVEATAVRFRSGSGSSAFRIAAACLLSLLAVEHGRYLWAKVNGPAPPWIQDGREVQGVTDFMNQRVPAAGSAVSTNPALLYLLTGHKAVAYVDPYENWERWQASGIRYAVALHVVPKPNRRFQYQVLYESPRLRLWVLELASAQP